MGIDRLNYDKPATRRDVGSVAIGCAVAIQTLVVVLRAIKSGHTIDEKLIAKIEEVGKSLEDDFDKLSGWSDAD